MRTLLAIPSDAPGGAGASLSAHFGHCDAFTLVTIEEGRVCGERILPAAPHDGNCLLPVRLLADQGVNAIVALGMGARPLHGFLGAGIQPFHAGPYRRVSDILAAFCAGELVAFGGDHTCGHHHEEGADCGSHH